MNEPGLGVLIKNLIGNDETRIAVQDSLNKTISGVFITDDNLYINFDDNTSLALSGFYRKGDELSYSKNIVNDITNVNIVVAIFISNNNI